MRLHRVLLPIALICACVQGYARIEKSPWADPPLPRVPGLIPSSGIGLPSSLVSVKDVYLIITITTRERRVSITALARKSVDPRKLASVLDRVPRTTLLPHRTIYWERAGDYSVAWENASPTYFLSRRLDIRIPVGALVSGVRSAGLHPHALLRVDGDDEIQGLDPSSVVVEGYRWHNVSQVPDDMVADLSIPLPWSASNSLKIIGLLAAFPMAALTCLILAICVAKSGRISASRRRSWYTGIYAGGISSVLICFCMAVFTLWEKASAALLAGTSSGIVVLFVVPAEAVLMLSMLAAGWFVGLRILPPPPADGSDQKELFPLAPLWWLIMLTAFQPVYRFVSHQAQSSSVIVGVAILVGFFALWMLLSSRIAWLWVKSRLALCAVDEELTARAIQIARNMGVSIRDVRVDRTENGRCYANAMVFIRQGYLIVTRKSLDVLTPEQLDWVLAHEVAHVKDGYPRVRGLLGLALLVFVLSGLIATLGQPSGMEIACEIVVVFAVVAVFALLDDRYSRQQELAADRKALIVTNCLRPAEAALMHIVQASPDPRVAEKDTTHPALSKRLAALRETATQLGIPTELPGAPGQR